MLYPDYPNDPKTKSIVAQALNEFFADHPDAAQKFWPASLSPVHPDAEVLPDVRSQIRRMNRLAASGNHAAAGELSRALVKLLNSRVMRMGRARQGAS